MDVKAVLDYGETQRAVLLGVTFGCVVAIGFAASYPERVQALVLAGGSAKLRRLGEFDFGHQAAVQLAHFAKATQLA